MMTNNTHQVADFDSIVGDKTSHVILLATNLLPTRWKIPNTEERRILGFEVKLKVVPKARGTWPACYVGAENLIEVAHDFLTSDAYLRDEKIATLLHEAGHAAFAFNSETANQTEANDSAESYLGSMERYFGDQRSAINLEEEFFADDFAKLCGFTEPLHSVLLKLEHIAPERIVRFEMEEPSTQAINP